MFGHSNSICIYVLPVGMLHRKIYCDVQNAFYHETKNINLYFFCFMEESKPQ